MFIKEKETGFRIQNRGIKRQGLRTHFSVFKAICALSLLFCILFIMTGCGEKDNEHLVNARHKIQQDKYKEAQDISQLKNELKLVLSKEPNNPEALCPLKALEIVESGANAGAQMVSEILTPINQLESQIKKLESIDKDLLTDEDKNQLDKLTRKWNLSLEPTAKILSSNTAWIDKVGDPAFDLLIESLKATNPIIQNDVVKILVQLKSRSYDFLVKALGNENSMVRRQALIALGKIGDDRAVEHITPLLNDKISGVRFYIPVSLELIGGEKIIEPLHLALKNEMSQVRMASAEILGRLKDETAASPLIELLGDDNSYVRASANDALLKIGAPSVPILIDVLQKKAENVNLSPSDFVGDKIGSKYKKELAKRASLQASISTVLGNMKDTSAITILLESMKMAPAGATEDERTYAASVRTSAITALQTIGASTVNGLISMLDNKSETETAKVNATSVLGTIGDRRAVVPLINALKDENKNVRAASATSLGTLKDRRALTPLIDALNDNDLVVRTNVAGSLGLMADKMATQPLLNILTNKEEREKLRTVALDSLGLIKDPISMEPILTILIDEYEKDGIRKNASTAMRLMENVYPSEALIALLKGEMVYPILMHEKGTVANWLKNEGDKNIDKNFTPLLEVSNGKVKREILAPASGTLIKIYTRGGQSAELGAIIGLISYKDKEIKDEERSSVRNMASSALGKVKGDNAVPALIDALKKDKNGAVRKNAASSLREIENAKARPALIDAMKHDDSGVVRSEAAYALGVGGLKNADNVPHLIDALQKDKYESTRVKAVWSLGELVDKRAIDALKKVIVVGRKKGEKEAPTVISEAITALDKIAAPAADPMLAVLKDKNVDEVPRSYAARILGLIESTNAVDQLITALKDDSVVVRSEAAKSLGLINDRRAVESLISVLKDENEWVTVRTNATWSLGNIKDERVVMPLIEALKSDVTAIHSNAVAALGTIKDKRAVLPLILILENPKEDDTIRASAITALASIGDLSATGAIMTALKSTNLSVKQSAVVAVGDLPIKESVDTLIAMVKDMNELTALRASAAESLGKIGDKKAIGVLTERLVDPNEPDTSWIKIATAAGKLKAQEVSAWVEERAKDTLEPVTVRNAAFMALSGTGNNTDFAIILEMLESATLEIRYGAALALGNSGRKDATQPMINRLQNDGEEVVRYYTATALGTLADPSSEQALIKAFKEDGTASVKNASAIALGEIKGRNGITALISILQDNTKGLDHRWNSAIALGDAKAVDAVLALKTVLSENNGTLHFEVAEALRKITGQSQGYDR